MVCGAQGNPGTVAPFRAWRGSRDLVAQSPKLHSPAAAGSLGSRVVAAMQKFSTWARRRELAGGAMLDAAEKNFNAEDTENTENAENAGNTEKRDLTEVAFRK